jgi:hypothetical protein
MPRERQTSKAEVGREVGITPKIVAEWQTGEDSQDQGETATLDQPWRRERPSSWTSSRTPFDWTYEIWTSDRRDPGKIIVNPIQRMPGWNA